MKLTYKKGNRIINISGQTFYMEIGMHTSHVIVPEFEL